MIKRPLCFICVIFLIIQALRVGASGQGEELSPSPLEQALSRGAAVSLTGTVEGVEEKTKVLSIRLRDCRVQSGDRSFLEEHLLVYIRPEQLKESLKTGYTVSLSGEGEAFEEAANPGGFDQKAYYRIQGFHVLVWADQLRVESREVSFLPETLSCVRRAWKDRLIHCLGEYYGNTMSAILLGEKNGLDPEMKKQYQKSGISHILAISGLHMSFIGMGIYGILRKMGASFLLAGVAGTGILLLYTLMIGAGPSALRALIMFLVRVGADISGRDYDLATSLSLAAALLVIQQPLYLLDAGFQLSFGAILGLLLLHPLISETLGSRVLLQKWKEKEKRREKEKEKKKGIENAKGRIYSLGLGALEGLASSTAVSIMLMGPLLYFYFEVPPCSSFLNLLVIPVMPAAMGAGLAGSAVCLVSEKAGTVVLSLCRGVLMLYDTVCEWAGDLPGSRYVTGQPGLPWILVYYLLVLALRASFVVLKERAEKQGEEQICRVPGLLLAVTAVLMCVVCRAGYERAGGVQVAVLDVGQGDGIHIRGAGADCLIDGGSSDVSSVGAYRIEPYLLSQATDSLDYVFVTHGDGDHISGISELLKGQKLGVRIHCLVLPPEEYLDQTLLALARTALENGTRVAVMTAGDQITWEDKENSLSLTCLGPACGAGLEPGNEASLVLGLHYGEFAMLFTGDLEGKGEELLLSGGLGEGYGVLKAAHHGSKNSNSAEFLQAVAPFAAVISAGRENPYGHPHPDTLSRLADAGCTVYSTQDQGAVILRTDGEKLTIF